MISRAIAAIGVLCDMQDGHNWFHPLKQIAHSGRSYSRALTLLEKKQKASWALLEGLVVFDEIAYDQFAFDNANLTIEKKEQIRRLGNYGVVPRNWGPKIYTETAEKIYNWIRMTNGMGNERITLEIKEESKDYFSDVYWDSDEKNFHDALFKRFPGCSFAESIGNSWQRAFFYTELARTRNSSLFPRVRVNESDELLPLMMRSYSQCVHAAHVDRVREIIGWMKPAELKLPFPPLAERIARQAWQQGRSLIEVAKELRETDKAVAYRRRLADIQAELQGEAPVDSGKLEILLKDFETVVKKWHTDGNFNEGLRYKTRTLKTQLIPTLLAFGEWLTTGNITDPEKYVTSLGALSIILGESITFHDPMLAGGEKYLSFVADWYS